MATVENIERVTNWLSMLGNIPGPQASYVQILTGNAGFAASMADLAEKKANGTLTKNDVIDVVQNVVGVVGAVAVLAGGGGVIAGSAALAGL